MTYFSKSKTPIVKMWEEKHASFVLEQEIMNTYITTDSKAVALVDRIIDMILQVDKEIILLSDIILFIKNNFNVMAFPSIAKVINDSDRLPKDNRSKPSIDGYPVLSFADHVSIIFLLDEFEKFKQEMFHNSPYPQIYIGVLGSEMIISRGQTLDNGPRLWKPENYSWWKPGGSSA